MARKGNRTRKSGRGIVSRVYSPFSHLFQATGESVGVVANTAGNVVKKTIGAVNKIGTSFSSHTNRAIHDITSRRRKNRKTRRNNSMKKTRRNYRK
jgi:hypothetical protein